jgi:hypothetical protein
MSLFSVSAADAAPGDPVVLPVGSYVLFGAPTVSRTCVGGVVTHVSMELPYDTTHLAGSLPVSGFAAFYNSGQSFSSNQFTDVALPAGRVGTQFFQFDVPAGDAASDTGLIWITPGAHETFALQCGQPAPLAATLPKLTISNVCGNASLGVDNRSGPSVWYDTSGSRSVAPYSSGTFPESFTATSAGAAVARLGATYGTSDQVWVDAVVSNLPCVLGTFAVGRRGWVSGTPRVGYHLYAHPSTLRPTAAHVSYRWLRNGRSIIGATGSTYLLTRSDRGAAIGVRITYTRTNYRSLTQVLAAAGA